MRSPKRSPGSRSAGKPDLASVETAEQQRTPEHTAPKAHDNLPSINAADSSSNATMLSTATPQASSSQTSELMMSEGMDPSVKYTKTGRISRANKGKRVHHCPECGKTYTRAEHLRRHQQNHKPGEFPCDVPGCNRSFFREDLLVRHKARHNDPNAPPSPYPPESPRSLTSGPSAAHVPRTVSVPYITPPSTLPPSCSSHTASYSTSTASPVTTQTGKRPMDLNIHPITRTAVAIPASSDNHQYGNSGIGPFGPDDSPGSSPHGSSDDITCWPYFSSQQHAMADRLGSDVSFLGHYPMASASRSPMSVASSAYAPHCAWNQQEMAFANVSSMDQYNSWINRHPSFQSEPDPAVEHSIDPIQALLHDRDIDEAQCLLVPTMTPEASAFDSAYTNEQRYLGAYFTHIHHFFPVVHKPSFPDKNVSPLLKAAMLALGAQALPDRVDKSNAKLLHDRCVKVLKSRTLSSSHTYLVSDLQAILLVEIYSIYKSYRPPLQLSQPFEQACSYLANDVDVLNPLTSSSSPYQSDGSVCNDTFQTVATCKQRVFFGCYILDMQHSILFGRAPLNCLNGLALDLPRPSSQVDWDGQRRNSSRPANNRLSPNVFDVQWGSSGDYDCFQSMLMMALLADDTVDESSLLPPNHSNQSVASCIEQQARSQITYHVLMLCKKTPVRELLGVAGESWVMGEKMANQEEFTMAQYTSRGWASSGNTPSSSQDRQGRNTKSITDALEHALRILKLHHQHPVTGLLFQDWAVYLASVVIWARAYNTATTPHRDRSQPVPLLSTALPHELDKVVVRTISRGAEATITMQQTRTVLMWTKAKMSKIYVPHCCGLTDGALHVLNQLIMTGDEVGWFGE